MQDNSTISKRYTAILLIVIIAIAAIVRLYGLDRQSLWYDEAVEETSFERQFLNDDPDEPKIKLLTPPLNSFFVFLMKSIYPGSDFAIRIAPFTFGLISIPLLFLLGRKMFNEKVGLIAAFLLAISPFHIWYSQDARMYSLQWMLALISLIYFLRVLDRPTIGNYAVFVISTAAGLYTHQLAFFLLVIYGLFLVFNFKKYRRHLYKFIFAFISIILLLSPWVIYSADVLMAGKAGVPKEMNIMVIFYTFFTYCAGFSIGPSLRELHFDSSLSVIKPYFPVMVPLMILYTALFATGLWSVRKDRPKERLMLLLVFTVPIAGLVILNKVMPNIAYNVRYTGTALFGFLLILAKGIEHLRNTGAKHSGITFTASALIVITAFSTYSYSNYQFNTKYHKDDIRGAATYINNQLKPEDLAMCIGHADIMNRYADRFLCFGINIQSTYNKAQLDDIMPEIIKGKKRFWLVLIREWVPVYKNIGDDMRDWLDVHYKEIKELHRDTNDFAHIRIYSYDLEYKKGSF